MLFCPWQYVPYEIHYRLFALEPRPFYLQQMVAVWLLLLVTYLLVRRWISPWKAFLASCLAVLSAPVATTVVQLMDVHYLHGLIFTVLAVHMFLLACDRQKLLPAAFGAGLYLLAMAAKQLPEPWQQRNGCRPVRLETFVETRRSRGTCYKAAN